MPSPSQGYSVVEGDGFLNGVRWKVGSLERWDEIRWSLDLALNRSPTDPSFATRILADLWATQISGPPDVVVLYKVSEIDRVVTYTGLIVL